MSTPSQFSDEVAGITTLLAARHSALTILRAVTEACGTVLAAEATGILVRDPRGGFAVVDASDDKVRFSEFLQAHLGEGPCVDSIDANEVVNTDDLRAEERWPRFVSEATAAGFHAVYAFPMRLIDHAIGGLNIFFAQPVSLTDERLRQAQVLADLAVLGLTQERDQRRIERLAERTMGTLNDRARVQQAVGFVAATLNITPKAARAAIVVFTSRATRSIQDVAEDLINGTLEPAAITSPRP
ncbi:GAF domain-containing protein [Amycolatopsis oliviviridis]|uniref:GAF domain-containing protein n=1 Tax=Amycolatopsis oliviviridis TaxID=1471590 RepID=UPI001E2A65D8|nr:GAF domain-containing protein [Amycolatopsis oliviviridis]